MHLLHCFAGVFRAALVETVLVGCSGPSRTPPEQDDTEQEVKKATLQSAAPPGMSEDIQKMHEGDEEGYEAMQKMYSSESMMP